MKKCNVRCTRIGRRSFISMGAAGMSLLLGCAGNEKADLSGHFDGKVLVIGAGPAGMTTAHLLQQKGVDFQVLEASASAGGRIRHNLEFTDFPIPLGAEWIHVEPQILEEIVNDPTIEVTTQLQGYDSMAKAGYFENGALEMLPNTDFQNDLKFIGSSWLEFFETFILPGISERISYNSQAVLIDHSGDRIHVTNAEGVTHAADKVVITAPLQILNAVISFSHQHCQNTSAML